MTMDKNEALPVIWGVTGGIGSGKSLVCRLLEMKGIPIYISDLECRRVMLTDETIRRELKALVGEDCYIDGKLNKPLLARYLFDSPEHAARVNAIVHPRVKADFRAWVARQSQSDNLPRIVAMESAILVEAGFRDTVDRVVMVSAPLEVRVARAMERDRAGREEIERRIKSQMSDEQKLEYADVVVYNDGKKALIPQLEKLLEAERFGLKAE